MKRARSSNEERAGLDLLEEATHLLRSAPAATLATYYTGSIPFILGLLFFLADMERNPFADEHLAEGALAVTALFFWMKFCQAWFARRIRAQLASKTMPRWGFRESVRVFFSQAVIQASGLFLIPLSLILLIPFAWVYAFYQSATALADPDSNDNWRQIKRAGTQAALGAWQNHVVVGLGFLLGLCILLNWTLVVAFLPSLIKMLLGIETTFSRSPIAMLNTTFLGGVLALTYLCVDPIMKTVYALRCFYGESVHSGEDLKADLKQFRMARLHVAVMLTLSLFVAGHAYAAPQQPPTLATASEISPEQLDSKIEEVIHQRKYTWRVPRGTVAREQQEKGIIARFMDRVVNMLRGALRSAFRWIGELIRRLFESSDSSGKPLFGSMSPSVLLYILLGAVLAALGFFLFRYKRNHKRASLVVPAPLDVVPDVADEAVSADQLPEDDWIRLARNLMEEGQLRLAMRAFYLATLAHLARRGLLQIARFKSNREYGNELRRRGHSVPDLLPLFDENLSMFERIWYGIHDVDRELVVRFADNVSRIKLAA